MKRILISMILLLLGTTLMGCGLTITYEPEKREINSMLTALQQGYLYEYPSQVMNCYADPFTKSSAVPPISSYLYYHTDYDSYLLSIFGPAGPYYTAYSYINRDINVTSSSRAIVYCIVNYYTQGAPHSKDMRFTVVKSWGDWLITEERTLSINY
jgi:hypothetical protein